MKICENDQKFAEFGGVMNPFAKFHASHGGWPVSTILFLNIWRRQRRRGGHWIFGQRWTQKVVDDIYMKW
jgi:hypothetical protein